MKKIKMSTETTIKNDDGKTLYSRSNQTFSYGQEPAFIKLYLQDVLYLADLPRGHENLLYELLRRTTYAGTEDGMQVTLSAGAKRLIAQKLGIKSTHTIDNILSDLVKGNILTRIEMGVYQLNPYLFGKGEWQDIQELRLEIGYNALQGRTFRSVIKGKAMEAEQAADGASLDDIPAGSLPEKPQSESGRRGHRRGARRAATTSVGPIMAVLDAEPDAEPFSGVN